jgi:L-aspartate oxidase
MQEQKISTITARAVILATGGGGQVFSKTTNPEVSTGDGVALAWRAGAVLRDLEFFQFHPTALFEPGVSPSFLITEAVRGDGGILRNKNGEAFMHRYDERKDLAPRDIVARAIDNEMKQWGTEHVYLDCRHMDADKFLHHFPNIHAKCLS